MRIYLCRIVRCLLVLGSLLVCGPAQTQANDAALSSLLERAQTAQGSGDYAGAARFYTRATALAPRTPELWSNRGVMELLAGRKDASIASSKRALQLNPQLYTPLVFLGRAYVEKGQPDAALPYLRRAHTLRPDDLEVLLTLARASSEAHQLRAALAAYSSASQLAPQNSDAWFGMGVSALHLIESDASRLAATQRDSVWSHALLADDLFAQGRPLQATETYKTAMNQATPAQKAILLKTLQWMQRNAEALELPPNSVAALVELSTQMAQAAAPDALPACTAQPVREKTSATTAGSATFVQTAACSFWADDDPQSAAQAAQALERSPNNGEALYWSIKADERIAVSALSHFETLSAHTSANYVLVGNLFRTQRQPDKAMSEYKKALAEDAHDPAALKGAILTSVDADRYSEAMAYEQTALADQPLDPELNLLMAELLDQQNDRQQEDLYLKRASGVAPELQPRLHYLLARLDKQEGKTAEAIEQYRLALPGDKDGSMHYQLSRMYRESGNLAAAQQALAEAKVLISKRNADATTVVQEAAAARP